MRKMFCDCCGAEVPTTTIPRSSPMGNLDLCPGCTELVAALDFRKTIMSELQSRLAACARSEGAPEGALDGFMPVSPSSVKGRYAPVKRAVLAAMEKKRAEFGLGYWDRLAEAAGVPRSVIDDMIERKHVKEAKWKAVARALGVDWPSEKEDSRR